MKSVSCWLFFYLIQMYSAGRTNTSTNLIRILLTKTGPKADNWNPAVAKSHISLDDSQNIHFGNISIGNPPQKIGVLFDTGSPHLWVFSSYYDSCDLSSETMRRKHPTYNRSASSTYVSKVEARPELYEYGTGWVFGFRSTDVVSIAGNEISQEFLEVTKASENKANANYHGIMGLAYPSKRGNIVSIFCDKINGDNKFSIYLSRKEAEWDNHDGELLLCGEDESKYIAGTMNYINEIDPGYWTIKIDRVKLNQAGGILAPPTKASIDTGTNRISGPEKNITKLYELVNAQPIENSDEKQVDCKSVHLLPNLIFIINGSKYTLLGKDYTQESKSDTGRHCRLLFHKNKSDFWIIGDVFFRKYYTVFDMKNHKIGFADIKR